MQPGAEEETEASDLRRAGHAEADRRWPAARREELAFVVERAALGAGESVLDAPAGTGVLAQHAPHGIHLVGVEPSPVLAARLASRPGLDARQRPLHDTGLGDATVDVVISVDGLHEVPDRGPVVAEWRRLLRPGGRLVIVDVAAGSTVAGFLDFAAAHRSGSVRSRVGYLPEDVGEQVEAAGFRNVSVADVDLRRHVGSVEEAVLFLTLLLGIDQASAAEVQRALAFHLGWEPEAAGVAVPWPQRVVTARRP